MLACQINAMGIKLPYAGLLGVGWKDLASRWKMGMGKDFNMTTRRRKSGLEDTDLLWVLCDFDNTIAYNSGHPDYILTKPTMYAREALGKMKKAGFKVVVYTARPWSEYKEVEDFLLKHKLPFRRIICGKPLGKYIIDDKAIRYRGNWDDTLKEMGI